MTPTPSAQYAAQAFVEAVCDRCDQAPRFRIHDRDSRPGPPQANAFCERVIGTLRRECLDNVIVLDDLQAQRIVRAYVQAASRESRSGRNRD